MSLYLMTQCQMKLRHSVTSLAQTLDYIEVARRHLLENYTLDQLLLKLTERKILLYISGHQRPHKKLEVHSVERMYLRQRCFDGWVNKTILKSRLAAAAGRANTYMWDFPDVKFRVAALIRYRRKQSGSSIRTIIRIGLKSLSVRPCPEICRHATFHPNPYTRFWVMLLTDRQTDRQIWAKTFTSFFVGCN